MENKVYTYCFETATPYLHPYQILHIFEEASGKFIHHIIMHESANTENRISLQVLDSVLQHITGSLRKPRRQRQRGKFPNNLFKEQNHRCVWHYKSFYILHFTLPSPAKHQRKFNVK